MVKGAFKRFRHEHFFSTEEGGTLMIDIFDYESPLGFWGKLADKLFLEKYMTRFLSSRNEGLKHYAETDSWREVLSR